MSNLRPEVERVRAKDLKAGDIVWPENKKLISVGTEGSVEPYVSLEYENDALRYRYAAPHWTYEIVKRETE